MYAAWGPALPGTAGLQPVLSLSYNSQVFDEGAAFTQASWVGSGWSLNTGAIVRNMLVASLAMTTTYLLGTVFAG